MIPPVNPPNAEKKWREIRQAMEPEKERIDKVIESVRQSLINNGIRPETLRRLVEAGFDIGRNSLTKTEKP